MRKGKKFAIINSYKKIAIPVEELPRFVEYAFLVETSYSSGNDCISEVKAIDKVEFVDGEDIDLAIAEAKLRE